MPIQIGAHCFAEILSQLDISPSYYGSYVEDWGLLRHKLEAGAHLPTASKHWTPQLLKRPLRPSKLVAVVTYASSSTKQIIADRIPTLHLN